MIPVRSKTAALCFAVVLTAGCSSASSNGLGSSSGALPPTLQTAALPRALQTAGPGPNAGGKDLLYITDYGTSNVKVYDWPSLRPVQTLNGFTNEDGLCVDANGNVFVANTNAKNIVEYAHGGSTPIATLADLPNYYPNSCAVDPVTGDLAVTNLAYGSGSETANVVIFKHATGQPKPYVISTIYAYYTCGYDDRGNLVVDGLNLQGAPGFAILRHGSSHLQALTLNQSLQSAGGVQWDGKHWAIGDAYTKIYQFDISGTQGTKVGETTLDVTGTVPEFFISGDRVIAPEHISQRDRSGRRAEIFKYPAGGSAIGSIRDLNLPFGAAISHGS